MILAFLIACGGGQEAVDAALAPWPEDPAALAETCAGLAFPELAITCRVQAAARYAQHDDSAGADAVCALVPEGTWREECHFRAGEELGKRGRTADALHHCRQAGWYARNCLTHTAWGLPADPTLTSAAAPALVRAAGEELLGQVDQLLAGAEDGLEGEGRDLILSRFGFNVYVGTGVADPAPAKIEGPLGVVLRTGFAIEAARLLPEPSAEAILAVWRGEAPVPTGAPLPAQRRVGRYTQPIPSPYEVDLPRAPVFGGGMRAVGTSVDEDMAIAALEGLYFREDTPAEAFLAHVDDPRDRVRWTAARLLRLVPPRTLDLEAELRRLTAEHADPAVRWHAQDGLDNRTWEPPKRRGPRR